jgi:hypothetical protein
VNQRVVVQEVERTVRESLDALSRLLPQFINRMFIKWQHVIFFGRKDKLANPKNTVVQVEFPENYMVQLQNEVQSARWSVSHVTVFIAFIWNAENEGYSCAFISDELDHNKYSVLTFLT